MSPSILPPLIAMLLIMLPTITFSFIIITND
nr:MAG TPA: hypothetical protein [Caudoviricetes sp.]